LLRRAFADGISPWPGEQQIEHGTNVMAGGPAEMLIPLRTSMA
jgi:hypothetical protein